MRTSHPSVCALLAGGLLAVLIALPAGASTEEEPGAPDVNRWTLPNGMRVVTQDVPHAAGVAVTIGYPYGSERDPVGMPGLASLLAEVAYTSPAGEIPQRSREDMPGIRPLGWNIKVTPRFTLLSEIVKPDHLAGMLYAFALRMKALSVTKKSLAAALETVHEDQARRHGGDVAWSLRQAVRDAATGRHVEATTGRSELDRLQPDDVRERVAAVLAPNNVVLTIAGPLGDQAIEKLTRDLFGGLPAGAPLDSVARAPLRPDSATIEVKGIDRPYGAFGVIAPALDNPSHPEFFLHAVLIGAVFSTSWGPPKPPLDAWFEYAVLDEPDLMCMYPPLPPDANSPAAVNDAIEGVMRGLMPNSVPLHHLQSVKDGVMWLVGGPLPADMGRSVARTPGIIYQLGASLAAREMTGGEVFWSAYRHRLSNVWMDLRAWRKYFELPQHQVRVIAVPAAGSKR